MRAWAFVIAVSCGGQAQEGMSVMRMVEAPAREPACALDVLPSGAMADVGDKTEALGTITFAKTGSVAVESFLPKARPKACELGGTALITMQSAQMETSSSAATTATFLVIRPKPAH